MWGIEGLLQVLAASGLEEALRFAYAASQLMPAGLVVGSAAVLAGLLAAAAVRKVRAGRSPEPSAEGTVPWVLGAALLAILFAAPPVQADVLCRKGTSRHLVLRTDECRPREHAVERGELAIEEHRCLQTIEAAWRELDSLRRDLEGARDLAARLERQPWDGAATWLAIQGMMIVQTLARLERLADELGAAGASTPIAEIRRVVTDEWGRPAEACAEALAVLPLLAAALPVPPAA